MPQVVVKDNEGSNIYSYNNTSKTLVLSSKATDTYKLTNDIVSVEYAFVENAAWTELTSNMSKDSRLEVDDATGVVTWKKSRFYFGERLQSYCNSYCYIQRLVSRNM